MYEEPDSLNPITANLAASNDPINLLFDGLVRFAPAGRIVPDLALTVPSQKNGGISPDGLTVNYHLRHDAYWEDGIPVTAGDVAFTWRAIMDPQNNVPTRQGYDLIKSIDILDKWTLRLHLNRRYAAVATLFACSKQGAIVPEHILKVRAQQAAFASAPIGSGPYRLVKWEHGSDLVFEPNPHSWQHPSIPRIQLEIFRDESSSLNAFLAHDLGMSTALAAYQVPEAEGSPGSAVIVTPSFQWEHIAFNLRTDSGPQANVYVRRAIASAMDVDRIYNTAYKGAGGLAPLDQFPGSWAQDSGVTYYPQSTKTALRYLDLAGYHIGPDGLAIKRGIPLRLSLISTTGTPEREQVEVLLQQQLRRIGIDLQLKNVSPTLFLAQASDGGMVFSGHFQLALLAYLTAIPDPDDREYVSEAAIPPNGHNVAAYRNEDVDRWSTRAASIYNRGARQALYFKIQQELIRDIPFYTLNWTPRIVAFDRRLQNIRPVPVGSVFWNVAAWTFRATTPPS